MSEIKIEGLNFGYEDGIILENVNIEIEKGDFVGIIGSNGTGKSTLIQLMLGLLPPKNGRIELNHENIGYVPQIGLASKADFPATVREIVMLDLFKDIGLFKRPNRKHSKMVDRALETVGLLEQADKQIGKLSGGQQQRVMIAKALVSSPQILILDEPTACIDEENEEMLYHLLSKLNIDDKLTIIMVTHSIDRIADSMNKIFLIKNKVISRRK